MRDLAEIVEDLSTRVSALEAENAALREAAAEPEAERPSVSRRNALRLGGLGAAVAAGSVLLRPGTAGATTGAMQFGQSNDAGTDATTLTSSSSDATLNANNTSTGAGLQAHITDTASQNGAVVGMTDSTDQNSAGVVGFATDVSSPAAGVLGVSGSGGGLVGLTGGPAPAVVGVTGVSVDSTGSAVAGIVSDSAAVGTAVEALQQGTGNCVTATIANTANAKRALSVTTNGTNQAALITITNSSSNASAARVDTKGAGAGVEASSSKGVGGKFTGKTAQIQLVPSSASTHPSSGARGQLFVDASGRLWYCFGGPFWKQIA